MINPTPMLRPSPMDISGLFAASFQAVRSRLGLFVLLVLFPGLLAILLVLVTAAIIGGAAAAGNGTPNGGLVILGFVVFFVGMIVVWLAQLKVYGMMSLAAYEIAQGQRPDFKGLMERSKGYLVRFLPLVLLGIAIAIVVPLILGLVFGGVINAASNNDNRALGGVAVVLMLLIFLLGIPLSIFLSVKLLYIVPSIALEQYSGMGALKRSWTVSKGSFWRTFGYAILPALAVGVVSYIISMITGLVATPLQGRQPGNMTPGEVAGFLLALLPVFIIGVVLQVAVQLITTPFLQSYYTYMYVDQVRRNELGAQPGYPGQPGYGYAGAPAQGQQYPPQGYPQQGQQYPPQGYPQQGQQYPPQGQQYPPQGQQYPPQGQQYPPQGQQYPPQGQPQQDPSAPPQTQNQWGQNPEQSPPPAN